MTLVECGPVHTTFMDNAWRADPDGRELRALDAETQQLYRRYLQHCTQLFLDAAQEVDEVLQVRGAGPGGAVGRTAGAES